MTEDTDRIGRSLDAALAEYGRCEPRTGLEGRVLAALRSDPPLPWWRVLLASRPAWAAASILVAVGGFVAVFLLDAPRSREFGNPLLSSVPERAVPAAAAEPLPFPPAPAVAEPPVPRARTREAQRLASAARTPRHPSFPRTAPLSEQERLLLRYVSEAPRDEIEPRAGFLDAPAPLPALPGPTTQP